MLSLIKEGHYVLLTGERYIRQGGSHCLMFYADIRLRWLVHTKRENDNVNKWVLGSSFVITARHPLLVTSGGHHWRPIQTCSPEDPAPTGTCILCAPPEARAQFGMRVKSHPTGMYSERRQYVNELFRFRFDVFSV